MSEFEYTNMDGSPLFSFIEAKIAILSNAVAQRAKPVTNILPSSPRYLNLKDTELYATLRVKCMDQLNVPS